jgi:polyketide cyclase/dehydrase/lipid transport protein
MATTWGTSTLLDIDPEGLWAFLTSATNDANWRGPWLRSVRQMTDGPMRIGTRYESTYRFFGREETVTTELTELDPPVRMAWRQVGTGSLAINDGTYDLAAVQGRTRFTVTGTIGATGWRRLILPAFGRYLNRAAVQQHRQLADALSRSRP